MALTTRKKNMIIADHKADRFETQTALLKHYKIDRKTLVKVLEGITTTNAHIVEAGVVYQNALKSLKNPVEIKAVEKAVEERTIADEIEEMIYEGTKVNVKGVKDDLSKEVVISMFDRKQAQETLDKALITIGKANRHAKQGDVNVNATAAVQTITRTIIDTDES